MKIKDISEIEEIINQYIIESKDLFLIENIYKIKPNWQFFLTDKTDVTQTAAVVKTNDGKYNIYFNTDFLDTHVKDKKDLIFVFLHEVLHIVNGDLLKNLWMSFNPKISNIIFDIKINSSIIKYHLKESYNFLKNLYGDTSNVFNLLLCPIFDLSYIFDDSISFNEEKKKEITNKIVKMKFVNEKIIRDKKLLAKWYIDVWFNDFSSDKLLYEVLNILDIRNMDIEVLLLGNHGHDRFGFLFEKNIDIDEFLRPDNKNEIIRMVKRVLEEDGEKKIIDKFITSKYGVIPNPGRREVFLMKSNVYPFFFPNNIDDDCETYKNSHVYIDVSASFERELPFIYKLVESAKMYISEPIFLFSDKIVKIRMQELKKGVVKTSFGTNFDNVLLHALQNKFKKILIITDGIGNVSCDLKKKVQNNMEIFVVLLENNKNPFQGIAKKTWILRYVS
ncbi:MAG: VWA domain-containing protein [Candidatus Goldbacteria bacterium]|nr:VWA domain-containing protein [Candidatus Goldiibacteriota bacterium]